MAFLNSLQINASGLTAQRLRMDVIAENLTNASTTRTAEGTPYRRRYTIFEPREQMQSFRSILTGEEEKLSAGRGVRVSTIAEDPAEFKLKYDPTHPDALEDGYVRLPNVDTAQEMVDMLGATRAYEANVTALNAVKDMAMRALEIGK